MTIKTHFNINDKTEELPAWTNNLSAVCPVCGRTNTVGSISGLNSLDPWGLCKCYCGISYFVNPWELKEGKGEK